MFLTPTSSRARQPKAGTKRSSCRRTKKYTNGARPVGSNHNYTKWTKKYQKAWKILLWDNRKQRCKTHPRIGTAIRQKKLYRRTRKRSNLSLRPFQRIFLSRFGAACCRRRTSASPLCAPIGRIPCCRHGRQWRADCISTPHQLPRRAQRC